MTQDTSPVGGEPLAPEPTLEDRLNAAFNEVPEEEEEEAPEAADHVEGEEPDAEEADEITEEDIEADLPPIDAPTSWTAEEKAAFAELPRTVQETVQRREAEREKFVQSKAQEAAQHQRAAYTQAAQAVSEMQEQAAQQLEWYAAQLNVAEPDPSLIASNPALYAQQVNAYRHYSAQRDAAQRQADEARQQAQHYQAVIQQQEQEEFHQRLTTELPEFFDEAKGPLLKQELAATAKSLGFSDEEVFRASASQIIALKRITDLSAKAEKYDALMRKQMERVRSGKAKSLPPVSKPGAAKSPGAHQNAQYQADRAAMRNGDKDATSRVLSALLDPKS